MNLVNRRPFRVRRVAALAVAAAVAALVPGMARADVFEQVPADTLMAVKVANLGTANKKIGQLAMDFGIAGFVPQAGNPLSALKGQLGITQGLKEDGDFGVAFVSSKASGQPGDQSFVLLVPVSNYNDFIGNFDVGNAEGDITEVKFRGARESRTLPKYAANWGGYAVLSPRKELLAKPASTLKLSNLPAREAGRHDFTFYANFAKIAPEALPELEKGVEKMIADMEKDAEVAEKWRPLLKTTINQLAGVARTFLNDSDGATIGLTIDDAGMNFTVLSAFKPESYLGKFAGELKGTDKPLTAGLPSGKYLFFGGADYDPKVAARVIDDVTKPVLDELRKVEGGQQYSKLADSFTAAIRANSGFTLGMPAPQQIGKEGIIQQVMIYNGGGAEMKTLMTESGSVFKQFLADLKLPADQPKMEAKHTPNSKQIEGIAFDTLQLDIVTNPDDPQAAQVEMMTTTMYGPEGLSYNYAQLGEKDFILTLGAPDATIAKFIKARQAKEENLSKLEHVKAVIDALPKQRLLEYYFAADEAVVTGLAAAAQFGMPVQVQVPPDLPPIGMTFGTDGPSMRFDVHVPTMTVQGLISAGMQAYMQMQRGRGAGGNL